MITHSNERMPVPHPALYKLGITQLAKVFLRDYGGLVHANGPRLDEVKSSYIMTPPHRSWLDIPAVGLSSYRHNKTQVHFMAKSEFWNNRLFGRILTETGSFPIIRGKAEVATETIEHIGMLAKNNTAICAFPEGGIKTGDVQKKNLKRGIAALAIYHGLPLVPVGIVGIADNFEDGLPIVVNFGVPIHVEQQDLDFSNARTVIAPASALRERLFEGMQLAQLEARQIQDQHKY